MLVCESACPRPPSPHHDMEDCPGLHPLSCILFFFLLLYSAGLSTLAPTSVSPFLEVQPSESERRRPTPKEFGFNVLC